MDFDNITMSRTMSRTLHQNVSFAVYSGHRYAVNTNAIGNSSTVHQFNSSTSVVKTSYEAVVTVYSLIFLCDITGNSIVVAVITLERKMKTFTNWMILNLAIADLAVGFFCIPLEIPLEVVAHKWIYGKFFCKIFYPLQTSTIYASVFTLVITSCSRYYAIVHPFRRQPSKSHAKWIICGIWVCSFLLEIPYIWTLKFDEQRWECVETWTRSDRRWFTTVTFVLQYVVPLLIIVTSYSAMIHEVKTKLPTLPTEEERVQRKENNQVTKLVIIVTVMFAACVLPYHVVGLLFEFADVETVPYIYDIFDVSYYILFLNSALNPIVYNIFSSNFRKGVLRLRSRSFRWLFRSRSRLHRGTGFMERLPRNRGRKMGFVANEEMQQTILTCTAKS